MKYATLYGLIFGFMLAVGALWQGLLGFLVVLVLAGQFRKQPELGIKKPKIGTEAGL